MKTAEIVKSAPRFLQDRYGSLSTYTWESLFPEAKQRNIKGRFPKNERRFVYAQMRSIAEEASLLLFVFVCTKIFLNGSVAAKETVDLLKELGVPGIYLGTTFFSERNEAVARGDNLARQLLENLPYDARALVLESSYAHQILEPYKNLIKQQYG